MKRFILFLAVMALGCGAAGAQMVLPGATPEGTAAPSTPKKHVRPKPKTPTPASIVDHVLLLNGADGELRLSGGGKGQPLRVEQFTLPGEVISDPQQKCRIAIIAQTPIEATPQGTPEGSARYSADIPACPLTFDVLDGAVLVPAQTAACVFQAADCQASPGGLWGPAGASLEKDAKVFTREHIAADASIAASMKALRERDKHATDDSLSREQNDFVAQREDVCHDYLGETKHGFCAARVSQARAALLRKRVEDAKHKGAKADP